MADLRNEYRELIGLEDGEDDIDDQEISDEQNFAFLIF